MSKEYKTFAQQFYLEEASFFERLGRDLRLVKWLLMNIVMWFKSRKIREEFESSRHTGNTFYVDRFAGPPVKK